MVPLLITLLFLVPEAKTSFSQDHPPETGVYWLGDQGWEKLSPAKIVDIRSRGLEAFIFSGGYTSLGMKGILEGPRASIRIFKRQPTILVQGVGYPEEVVLVRLKRERNRRSFETASSEAAIDNKKGFRKKDIIKTEVVAYSDSSFSVSPREPLSNGEYLLVFAETSVAFDFGVDVN